MTELKNATNVHECTLKNVLYFEEPEGPKLTCPVHTILYVIHMEQQLS